MHGRVLRSRLKERRATISGDPFHELSPSIVEPLYHRLEAEQKTNFWLNRFERNIPAYLWPIRGLIDIHATLQVPKMSDYLKSQFVLVCSTMWEVVIAPEVGRANLAQAEGVAERGTNLYVVTNEDRDRYRLLVERFNIDYNTTHPDKVVETLVVETLVVETLVVETLEDTIVQRRTINTPMGNSVTMSGRYTGLVEAGVRIEETTEAALANANRPY